MREPRWRRVAVAVVVAVLVPSLASAARKRAQRVLPAGARAATAPASVRAGDPVLDSAVARLRASLDTSAGQAVGADQSDQEAIYLTRTGQGYVRALQAPAGHAFVVTPGTTSSPEGLAVAFLREHGRAFGMSRAATGLRTGRVRSHLGRTFVRLEQRLGRLPIFGAAAVVQVEASGGVSCGIKPGGILNNFAINKKGERFNTFNGISFNQTLMVVKYNEIVSLGLEIAKKFLYHRLLGFDFCVNETNEIKLIEINNRNNEINFFQMNNGPLFREYTNEVVEFCKRNNKTICLDYEI